MLAEPGAALNIDPTGTAWEKKPLLALFTDVPSMGGLGSIRLSYPKNTPLGDALRPG
jgi:hypothetical protein